MSTLDYMSLSRLSKVCGLLVVVVLVKSLFFTPHQIYAATLSNVSDTITTSRPSASAPINANQAASASNVTVFDNGSNYLASDSATLRADTGETQNIVTVASQSASSGSPAVRTIYFTGTAANTHHAGDVFVVPITALHTVAFTTINTIPTSGSITLAFPTLTSGDANTPASPSATTFQMNGLSSSQIIVSDNGSDISSSFTSKTVTNPSAGTAPTITLTLNGSSSIAAGHTVRIFLGCTAGTTSCSAQAPMIINPTTNSVTAGTARTWAVTITTRDVTNSTNLDSGLAYVGTVDSVRVTANVAQTFTFTIAGINNATAINNGNSTGCTNSETTNTGFNSNATDVNLGTLGSGINIAAQLLTVTTNAINGYSLTATSSGHLINPSNGYWLADSTTPTAMTAGTTWFGIHACGLDVNSSTWGTGATGGGTNAKYAWPTQTTAVTLASDATGPIANSIAAGNGLTSVEYAATVDGAVPAGTYNSVVTYVATPTF